jgi:hypothetical protein
MLPEELSLLQKGIKRPGIGGRKKGFIPWNKGIKWSDDIKKRWSEKRKGIFWGKRKISENDIISIITAYKNQEYIENVGQIQKNGKKMNYLWAFSLKYAVKYNVNPQTIKTLIKKNVENQ